MLVLLMQCGFKDNCRSNYFLSLALEHDEGNETDGGRAKVESLSLG